MRKVKNHWQSEAQTPSGPVKAWTLHQPLRGAAAGGGLYELEFYAAVRACGDIEPGLYHYDPEQHRLERTSGATCDCSALLDDAALSSGIDSGALQVLIILTARFARIAWKYESIAYSLILKDVGVAYQTMYLAATAMNRSLPALGLRRIRIFFAPPQTDYFAETSVGESCWKADVLTREKDWQEQLF